MLPIGILRKESAPYFLEFSAGERIKEGVGRKVPKKGEIRGRRKPERLVVGVSSTPEKTKTRKLNSGR